MDLSKNEGASAFFRFPSETLYQVAYHLTQRELRDWALTCRHFEKKLLPVLYKLDVGKDPYQTGYPYGSHKSLAWACRFGLTRTLESAISEGADVDFLFEEQSGMPRELQDTFPLHVALLRGHDDLARILIEHGADVTALSRDSGNYSAMYYAKNTSMVQTLHNAGWTTDVHRYYGPDKSIIWWMIKRGASYGAVASVLDIGVSVDDEGHGLAMLRACAAIRLDIVRLLLSRGFRFETASRHLPKHNGVIATGLWYSLIPGTYEQLCLTITLHTILEDPDVNSIAATNLVQLLLQKHRASGKMVYENEICLLIMALSPNMPIAVRALLIWESPLTESTHIRLKEPLEIWEKKTATYIVEKAFRLLQCMKGEPKFAFGTLSNIISAVKQHLYHPKGFDWPAVQPLIKRLLRDTSGHLDNLSCFPSHYYNQALTEKDEALTVELIGVVLKNGADPDTRVRYKSLNAGVLAVAVAMISPGRVKLLVEYGVKHLSRAMVADTRELCIIPVAEEPLESKIIKDCNEIYSVLYQRAVELEEEDVVREVIEQQFGEGYDGE